MTRCFAIVSLFLSIAFQVSPSPAQSSHAQSSHAQSSQAQSSQAQSSQAQPFITESEQALVGLWSAVHRAGPELRGELVVERRGDRVVARIGGVAAEGLVETGETGDASQPDLRVDLEFPHQLGTLRARLDGDVLRGHWIQPPGVFLNGSWATPVVLAPLASDGERAARAWSGRVEPLDDRLTLFLSIERDAEGGLHGWLRNPERNVGVFLRVGAVTLDGDEVVLHRRDGDELARARRHDDPERLSMHVQGSTFDFARVDPDAALGFAPRIDDLPGSVLERPVLERPVTRADGWRTGTPEAAGLDPAPLAALVESLRTERPDSLHAPAVQALLVAHRGRLVVEEYFGGFHADQPHDTRSASKSLSSLLVGTVVDRGLVAADDTVLSHVGDRWPVADPDPRLAALEVRHLLAMSGGFDCDDSDSETPGNEDRMQNQGEQPDWIRYILDVPMVRAPGERGVYCSAGIHLLSGVLSEATGTWLPRLVDTSLLRPLGIDRYHLNLTPTGDLYFGGGWRLRPRDMLKFGQLMLDGGVWNGRRVVGADWLAASAAPHASLNEPDDYGYAWWRATARYDDRGADRTVDVVYASGNGGQLLLVVPELDLVVLFMAGNYSDYGTWRNFREVWLPRDILPAVRDEAVRGEAVRENAVLDQTVRGEAGGE